MTMQRAACATLALWLSGSALYAQTAPPTPVVITTPQKPPQTTPPADPPVPQIDLSPLPIDLARVKRVLERTPPTARVDDSGVRFYMDIIARHPTFKDILGDYDLKNGPTPTGGMTHQEFLNSVTPRYLNSSAGFTATDTLQASLVNWAAQSVIKKGINALKKARSDAEVRSINAQIDRELAALRGGG